MVEISVEFLEIPVPVAVLGYVGRLDFDDRVGTGKDDRGYDLCLSAHLHGYVDRVLLEIPFRSKADDFYLMISGTASCGRASLGAVLYRKIIQGRSRDRDCPRLVGGDADDDRILS